MQGSGSADISIWAKVGCNHSLPYLVKPVDTHRKIDKHKCTETGAYLLQE